MTYTLNGETGAEVNLSSTEEYREYIQQVATENADAIEDGYAYDVACEIVIALYPTVDEGRGTVGTVGEISPVDVLRYSDTKPDVPVDELESLGHQAALKVARDLIDAAPD